MKELVEINDSNVHLINEFLNSAGSSLTSFRYFNSRSTGVIKNHIVTYIFLVDDLPVGYGHLDKEDEIVWLGIAVIEHEKGKGYGAFLIHELIDKARLKNVKNNLSQIPDK